MRIEKTELRHVKMKLVSPFENSLGVENYVEHIIVSISADGITGWGEVVVEHSPSYSYETLTTAWHVLKDFIIPSISGKVFNDLHSAVALFSWIKGHNMAKAGVEAALADILAKSKKISLSEFLGGTKGKVEAGVSIGLQPNAGMLVKSAGGYLSEGYKRIKIKIARGRDIELVKAVRAEYPKILLQVDANSAYTLNDIVLLKSFDEYNLQLIEQPLGHDDLYEHSLLQSEIKTAVCLDESIAGISDASAAIALGSCKIINIKPGRIGGFTESIKVHDYCLGKNIPVWCGGMYESGIGRAGNLALASLPGFTLPGDISASKRYFDCDIVEPEFVINNDGTMDVPSNPGIGVEVNMKKLESVTVSFLSSRQ